jgi:uncharacterized Zn-binding protein involved in type VI secretion
MPPAPAARVGDLTGHPGAIDPPGVLTVEIGGQPAATVGTPHLCSIPPPAVHPPPNANKIETGSQTVLIGGQPAARVGDHSTCLAPITTGCRTVLIGG